MGLSDSPGAEYYRPLLKSLIDLFGDKKLSEEIFVAEYFPYYTISGLDFSKRRGLGSMSTLSSQRYTFDLVREAMRKNAVIIWMRGPWYKAIPDLKGYQHFYRLRNYRRTYVSQNNCPDGWGEIIKVLSS